MPPQKPSVALTLFGRDEIKTEEAAFKTICSQSGCRSFKLKSGLGVMFVDLEYEGNVEVKRDAAGFKNLASHTGIYLPGTEVLDKDENVRYLIDGRIAMHNGQESFFLKHVSATMRRDNDKSAWTAEFLKDLKLTEDAESNPFPKAEMQKFAVREKRSRAYITNSAYVWGMPSEGDQGEPAASQIDWSSGSIPNSQAGQW